MELYVPVDMNGKTVLVTGGSSGIGFCVARTLASAGATVAITARRAERGAEALRALNEAARGDRAELYLCDFEDLECVRSIAEEIGSAHPRLDVLVNNAGAIYPARELTSQGFERTWQVDHLAGYLLTRQLHDSLARAGTARVILVSSDAHFRALGGVDMQDPSLPRGWSSFKAYAQAKLANVMFAYELDRRWQAAGVRANAMHPGPVRSGFGVQGWGWSGRIWSLGRRFMLSPEEGADTIVWLAAAPEAGSLGGQYVYRQRPKRSSRASYDEAAQRALWRLSARQVGLDPDEVGR